MKKLVYTILDEKAATVGTLFLAASDAEAIRTVHASLPKDSIPCRYPADFALLRLAEVELGTGQMVAVENPVLVAKLDSIFAESV